MVRNVFHFGCDKFIPKLKVNNKKSAKDPLWMNNELKNLCRRKRNLWFTCRNTRFSDSLIVNEYKQLNIKIKKLVKQNIREFEQILAKNSRKNPKAVFAYINSKTKSNDSIKAL